MNDFGFASEQLEVKRVTSVVILGLDGKLAKSASIRDHFTELALRATRSNSREVDGAGWLELARNYPDFVDRIYGAIRVYLCLPPEE